MAEKLIEPDFTIGDIVSEFEEEFGPPGSPIVNPDDCYTTQELCAIWDIADSTVRRKLKQIKLEGRLIETTKDVKPLGRPGVRYPSPAYQVGEKTND